MVQPSAHIRGRDELREQSRKLIAHRRGRIRELDQRKIELVECRDATGSQPLSRAPEYPDRIAHVDQNVPANHRVESVGERNIFDRPTFKVYLTKVAIAGTLTGKIQSPRVHVDASDCAVTSDQSRGDERDLARAASQIEHAHPTGQARAPQEERVA